MGLIDTQRTGRFEIGNVEIGDVEVGYGVNRFEIGAGQRAEIGKMDRFEIGAPPISDPAAAVKQVVKTARDNRQPPPVMKAVDVNAPMSEDEDEAIRWFTDACIDVGCAIGAVEPFPLMTKLLQRFGAGQEKPRFVRVDTEESYKQFRVSSSPEMADYQARLRDLADKLEAHVSDPYAHENIAEKEELLRAEERFANLDAAERQRLSRLCWL